MLTILSRTMLSVGGGNEKTSSPYYLDIKRGRSTIAHEVQGQRLALTILPMVDCCPRPQLDRLRLCPEMQRRA